MEDIFIWSENRISRVFVCVCLILLLGVVARGAEINGRFALETQLQGGCDFTAGLPV